MAILKYAHIIKDELMSGSARIAGIRIRVRDIVEKYVVSGCSPEDMAEAFRITSSSVYEALSYYYENAEEIGEEIKRDEEFVKKFREQLA